MWKMFCNVFKTATQYYIHYVYIYNIYSNFLIYIYIYRNIYIFINMHIYICIYIYEYIYIYVSIYAYIFPMVAYLYKYTMVSGVFRMNGGRAYSECLV